MNKPPNLSPFRFYDKRIDELKESLRRVVVILDGALGGPPHVLKALCEDALREAEAQVGPAAKVVADYERALATTERTT